MTLEPSARCTSVISAGQNQPKALNATMPIRTASIVKTTPVARAEAQIPGEGDGAPGKSAEDPAQRLVRSIHDQSTGAGSGL